MTKYKGNDNRIVRIKHDRVHMMINHAAKFWDLDYQLVFEIYLKFLIVGYPPYAQEKFTEYVAEYVIED